MLQREPPEVMGKTMASQYTVGTHKHDMLIIIGAGGHGRVAADIAALSGWSRVCFLDDDPDVTSCAGYDVIGDHSYAAAHPDAADYFVAVGSSHTREELTGHLEDAGIEPVTLIHPSAVIGSQVVIGAGSILMPNCVVNTGSVIGRSVIINTAATVDHDNRIGDFSHISVGAHLAGAVTVGCHTWIGVGASVINNLTICGECMIGAGGVVVRDILTPGTYVGVPARPVAIQN